MVWLDLEIHLKVSDNMTLPLYYFELGGVLENHFELPMMMMMMIVMMKNRLQVASRCIRVVVYDVIPKSEHILCQCIKLKKRVLERVLFLVEV